MATTLSMAMAMEMEMEMERPDGRCPNEFVAAKAPLTTPTPPA
jgi:hypothetical protein